MTTITWVQGTRKKGRKGKEGREGGRKEGRKESTEQVKRKDFLDLHTFWHLDSSLAWVPSLLFHVARHIEGTSAWILLCRSVYHAHKGPPCVESYSVVHCVRLSMGQPLYCSAANVGVWGENWWWWLHHPIQDSAVFPFFNGCQVFLHKHFSPQPPPSHPLCASPQSISGLILWFHHNPQTPGPRQASRGPVSCPGYVSRTVLFSFYFFSFA